MITRKNVQPSQNPEEEGGGQGKGKEGGAGGAQELPRKLSL